MNTIENALNKNLNGLCYGNRIILPFNCTFLKVIIEDDIITDFSPASKGIYVREKDDFTELYFLEINNVKETVSKYENIKLVAVEKGDNLFDLKNHKKIALYIEEKHNVKIEKTEDDILFIE
ncbi:MAG TPA: hypothetical protein VKA26_00660 [Ignavibacteriaceae bacterium]|nr:hypothetical protein [Ignavibacteriaceae bacterium]